MKSKKTKRALISSVLALVLCFVMLLGTTFAWFTDTASTAVNSIQAGTLDVELLMKDGDSWVSAEDTMLSFVKAEGHETEEVLWEPGCTYELPTLRIVNNGNLALKYEVVISAVSGDTKLAEALDVTLKHSGTVTKDESCGKLNNLLNKVVTNEKHLLAGGSTEELTISVTMDENAGNEYQGLSIDGIAITVYATQYTYEYDSTTDQYDKDADFDFAWDGKTVTEPKTDEDGVYHITSAAEFAGMMEVAGNSIYSGETIVLDCDIDFGGQTIKGVGSLGCNFSGTFDGQGHTVSNFVIDSSDRDYYAGLFNQVSHGGKITNLTVSNATIKGSALVGAIASSLNNNSSVENCKVYNCTLIGGDQVGAVVGGVFSCSVTDCYAENCDVFYSDGAYQNTTNMILGYVDGSETVSDNTYKNVTVSKADKTISTKAELFDFAESVNVSKNSYNGQTVVLTADIDLGNTPWTPIGDVTNQDKFFQGTFDGNGHTIYNLYVDMSSDSSTDYTTAGLFGWVDATNGGCTIKNLTIDGATVKGNHFTGAVVGYMTGTIDNCHVKNATIVSKHLDGDNCGDKAGGVVGILNSNTTVKNCSVSDSTITAARDAGQVIGCLNGQTQSGNRATNVTVTADTTGCNHSGAGSNITNGIVGRTA